MTLSLASDASLVSAKIGTTDLTEVSADSDYTFDATGLAEGDHVITVVSQDAAGNQTTTTKTVSIDTAAPTGTTVSAVSSDNAVNAAEKAAGVIVSGAAEANSSVAITWGGVTRTTTADAGGNWSLAYTSAQIPTDQSAISVLATDASGLKQWETRAKPRKKSRRRSNRESTTWVPFAFIVSVWVFLIFAYVSNRI